MYKFYYKKYKSKYLNLKKQIGNGYTTGFYEQNGKKYISFKTENGNYISIYEEPIENFKLDDQTNNLKKPNPTKIITINTIDQFDHFTTKYGSLTRDKIIYINWEKVSKDYKGFYLNKSKELYLQRHDFAMYKMNRYPSWWSYEYNFINVIIFG